jgi:hypothetical protein
MLRCLYNLHCLALRSNKLSRIYAKFMDTDIKTLFNALKIILGVP